jgi:hypothetical protein
MASDVETVAKESSGPEVNSSTPAEFGDGVGTREEEEDGVAVKESSKLVGENESPSDSDL